MSSVQRDFVDPLKKLAYFERRMNDIKEMPVETALDRMKKNLAAEKLHVRILKRMLAGCNHSRENLQVEFEKLLAVVESLRELIF